jgi:hypothetical protein
MDKDSENCEQENSANSEAMCKGCPQGDECRKVWSAAHRGPFTPMGLTLGSALVFLLPIATAIAAGVLVRELTQGANHATIAQILAAVGGLVLGAFGAWLLMPVIKKRYYER